MLNPNFSYVSFDFETTWLDTKKDEAIQIWIVKFDHTCTVTDTYVSYIKPNKDIKELKEIVRFVTWVAREQLTDAPAIEEILPRIQEFFDENTIIIGHNIWFDLAILQKYRDYTPAEQIDTYILWKACNHFKASYALDVLHKEIEKDTKKMSSSVKYHDALADSYAAAELFQRCIQRITHLRHTYLLLDYVIQESTWVLKKIIKRTEKPYKFSEKKLFFPALKTSQSTNKKILTKDPLDLQSHSWKKWYIWHHSLHSFLKHVDRSENKYILAFTHKSKQHIAQQYLQQLWVATQTLHNNVIFDPDQVNNFLQKKSFSDEEVLFVQKYYSHFAQWHSIMDVNSASDYMIFNALTTQKPTANQLVTLGTHMQLFQLADNISSDQTILFFDHDRRYTNWSKWKKQPFDPLRWISFLEQEIYKSRIAWDLTGEKARDTYAQQATLFVGVLSTEIDKLFLQFPHNKQETDSILEHTRFPKAKPLFNSLEIVHQEFIRYTESKSLHDTPAVQTCLKYRKQLCEYLHDACEIEKRMYNWDKRYYVLHQRNMYLWYEEFIEDLPKTPRIFLSNSNTQHDHIWIKQEEEIVGMNIITEGNWKLCIRQFSPEIKAQFVFSTSKQASQKLFNECVNQWLQNTYTIVAENITWGIGKNLYLAWQSTKPLICIWWINFYLEALAKKFDFWTIFLYHLHGSKKEQLVHDILWYKD